MASYTLQNTSEENGVVSDLECIVGGTSESSRPQASRRCFLLAGAVLTVAALAFALGTRHSAHVARPAAATGLSEVSDEWKSIIGDKAYSEMKKSEENLGEKEPEPLSFEDVKPAAEVTTRRPALRSTASTAAPQVATTFPASIETLTALAEEMLAEAQKYNASSAEHRSFNSIGKMIKDKATSLEQGAVPSSTESPLAPEEALDDGNKCPKDEEEYAGTCFKKCIDLTGGAFPLRSSAMSCCAAEPCSVSNSKMHLSFCGGFDVSGNSEGNGCPAPVGACLKNEEMFDGLCYKKCSLFAEGTRFNHRVAPNICCSTTGFRCLLPSFMKFGAGFAVGGGAGDGNSATPGLPHAPMMELTETVI